MDDLADGCGQEIAEETPSSLKAEEREGRRRNKDRNQKSRIAPPNPKPWRNSGADITDYFNYGFTEESWESYCQKQREIRVAMRKLMDRHSRHQEERIQPSSAYDSHGLYPRRHHDSCRSSSQDLWIRRNRRALSPVEDRATHLFTSPDSTCPSDLGLKRLSSRPPHGREVKDRSKDREERRERQRGGKERGKRHDQVNTSTGHTQQEQDNNRGRHRRRERNRDKRRRQGKETPKETAKETSPA